MFHYTCLVGHNAHHGQSAKAPLLLPDDGRHAVWIDAREAELNVIAGARNAEQLHQLIARFSHAVEITHGAKAERRLVSPMRFA
jgi:hypothetical protein